MSEQFVVDSDILIEILSNGCGYFDCCDCPFNNKRYEKYCRQVSNIHTESL